MDTGMVSSAGSAIGHESEERLEDGRLLGLRPRLEVKRFFFFVHGRKRLGLDGIGGLVHSWRCWKVRSGLRSGRRLALWIGTRVSHDGRRLVSGILGGRDDGRTRRTGS